jgi:hypothetical protein
MRMHLLLIVPVFLTLGFAPAPFPKVDRHKTEEKDEFLIETRNFILPIRIDPEKAADIAEVRLHVSADCGKTWNLWQTIKPDERGFAFRAGRDGRYWFTAQTISTTGVADPRDIFKCAPGQKNDLPC